MTPSTNHYASFPFGRQVGSMRGVVKENRIGGASKGMRKEMDDDSI